MGGREERGQKHAHLVWNKKNRIISIQNHKNSHMPAGAARVRGRNDERVEEKHRTYAQKAKHISCGWMCVCQGEYKLVQFHGLLAQKWVAAGHLQKWGGCTALRDCRNSGDDRWFVRVRVVAVIRLQNPLTADRAVSDFRDPTAAQQRRLRSSPAPPQRTTTAATIVHVSATANTSGMGAEV